MNARESATRRISLCFVSFSTREITKLFRKAARKMKCGSAILNWINCSENCSFNILLLAMFVLIIIMPSKQLFSHFYMHVMESSNGIFYNNSVIRLETL